MIQGMLAWFFWLSAMVSAVLAPLVLWRYSSGVLRGMGRHDAAEIPPAQTAARPAPAAFAAAAGNPGRWDPVLARRLAWCWLLSFLLSGLLLAPALTAPSWDWSAPALLAHVLAVLLPAGPTLAVALGWSGRRLVVVTLSVLLGTHALLALGLVALIWSHGAQVSAGPLQQAVRGMALHFVLLAWPPLLLMLICGAARVRGVMPVMFAGLLVFAAGPFLGTQALHQLGDTGAGTRLLLHTGLATPAPLFAALAVPFAWLAWRGLRRLSNAYRRKRFSELQLLAQAWWLMTAVPLALPLLGAQATWIWCAAVLVSVATFVPIQRGVFAMFDPARGAPPARMLLVLRVFGWRSRTQRLFDRVVARWRLHGPVSVVAAPDVVARTVDPADFVDWLVGRHDESFIRDAAGLQARLAAIDADRDPDARFRITEFCCADNSWRAAVVALMARADVVLMDLRDFTPDRAGCEFELRELGRRVDPRRVVLLVSQDAPLHVLRDWLGPAAASVCWLELPRSRWRLPATLMPALFAASNPAALPAAADRPVPR